MIFIEFGDHSQASNGTQESNGGILEENFSCDGPTTDGLCRLLDAPPDKKRFHCSPLP
jgi:hypothetical protein